MRGSNKIVTAIEGRALATEKGYVQAANMDLSGA